MKYATSILAAATIALAAPALDTLPQLGGVNTAGYDFSVVCNASQFIPSEWSNWHTNRTPVETTLEPVSCYERERFEV